MILYESVGILKYTEKPSNLRVLVDPGIADFYRWLIPKWVNFNIPRYPPHISVVRKEIMIPNVEVWGKYEGQEVSFVYSNEIHHGTMYYWLNVFSTRLEEIRLELGLPVSTEYTRPPDGFVKCFHLTIANSKNLNGV